MFLSREVLSVAVAIGVFGKASVGIAQPPPATPAPDAEKAIRVDVRSAAPLAPAGNLIRAYAISSPEEFVAGQLADSFFDDFVLQNNQIKIVVAHPGKHGQPGIRGGNIIDVCRTNHPLDYINGIQQIPDLETTGSAVDYSYADPPTVSRNTTATLVLHGKAVAATLDPETTASIDVTTTYTLGRNTNILTISTAYSNNDSTETVYILPGDLADWGEALGFVEGVGVPSGGSTVPANFVLGFASEYSVGIVTSGTQQIHGYYTPRDAVIPGYQAPVQTSMSLPGRTPPAVRSPAQRATEVTVQPGEESKTALEVAMEKARQQGLSPSTETKYGAETRYGLSNNGNSTASLQIAENPSSGSMSAVAEGTTSAGGVQGRVPPANKVALQPGKSFSHTRFLVVSDSDFSRIVDAAYNEKHISTGNIVGAVLEANTDQPLANVDVQISGGPTWIGNIAPAFYRVRSRPDGTFSCRVPIGRYLVSASKVGRAFVSEASTIDVRSARPQSTVLLLSQESVLRIAVSEAETPTSIPLPCKLTFVSKQGTNEVNWGDGPRGDRGIRNTWFLPYGAANIPITPGKYQMYISRGVEYDDIRADINVAPGTQQVLKYSLPHTMRGMLPGMFSVDAGVVTSASASSVAPIEDRVIQAACEGVHVIVSGDYNRATDLQPVIDKLGLGRWVKGMMGMRLLLHKGDETAEVLAYPLTHDGATSLTRFLPQITNVPPDLALSDLKKNFPGVVLEIVKPTDPERGYFARYPWNSIDQRFATDELPPHDYDSIEIYEGKKLGLERTNYPRYSDLQVRRSNDDLAKVAPLSPTAYSGSSLPFGQEIGYPRLYVYTDKKSFRELSEADIVKKIRGQHYMVTNGPITSMEVQSLPSGEYNKRPGDVIDLSTTRILRLQLRVLAANWVSFSGLAVHEAGLVQVSTPNVRPLTGVKRYPVVDLPDVATRYLDNDAVLDGIAYGANRPLWPIVSNALPEFGGPVYPYSFTGPVFVDKEADGKIRLSPPNMRPPENPRTKQPPPDFE